MLCDEVREESDAYAVGALDPKERDGVERHLESCAECREALEQAVCEASWLALAAPLHRAPRELHTRLMHQIAAEGGAPEPASFLGRLSRPQTSNASSRAGMIFEPRRSLNLRRLRWLQPVAASLAVILLMGSAVWIIGLQMQVNRLQTRSQALQRGLADFEGQRAALMLLASDGTNRIEMQPTDPAAGATGAVIWNPTQRKCSVFVSGLPGAPADQSYHVWFVGTDRSWDSGELSTSGRGTAEKTIDLSRTAVQHGYQLVVSLQPRQAGSGDWQPVLKAWVGAQ